MSMATHYALVFVLLALLNFQAVARRPHHAAGWRPLVHRPLKFPRCMYVPFHEKHGLFSTGKQKRVGEVSVKLSDRKISVTYSLHSCRIKAGHVDIVEKLMPHPIPSHFACQEKVSWAKRKLTVVCRLKLFPRVPCCKKFFIYTHASLACGRKKVDAYGGKPSCGHPAPRKWGKRNGKGKGRKGKMQCNVISVKPPCPRRCTCNRKCVCPKPMPSMSNAPVPSNSNSPTPSASSSSIPSVSSSPVPSMSRSPTPSRTPTPMPTPSVSNSPIPSVSSSPVPSMSRSPTPSRTPTPTPTPSVSNSPIPSVSSSPVPSMSRSPTPSRTPTPTPTPSVSSSPIPSVSTSPVPSMTGSPTPSRTPTPSPTPTPSVSNSPIASMSISPIPSMSNSPTPSMSNSPTPSMSNSPTPSMSNSPTPSMSNLPAPSVSNSPLPSMSPSPTPCMCPNCFICMGIDGDGNSICEVDTTTNDADCNPCENGGDQFCEATGLPNSFKCCPPTSKCKDTVVPTRLNVDQSDLQVSFVCSSNCGQPCDDIGNDGDSNACALFTPLMLGNDGDSDTDDVFNLCPDLSAD